MLQIAVVKIKMCSTCDQKKKNNDMKPLTFQINNNKKFGKKLRLILKRSIAFGGLERFMAFSRFSGKTK